MADEMKKDGNCCDGGHHKCWCKGGILIILAILGFLSYGAIYHLPGLNIIWPIVALVVGILDLFGICCCCMKK